MRTKVCYAYRYIYLFQHSSIICIEPNFFHYFSPAKDLFITFLHWKLASSEFFKLHFYIKNSFLKSFLCYYMLLNYRLTVFCFVFVLFPAPVSHKVKMLLNFLLIYIVSDLKSGINLIWFVMFGFLWLLIKFPLLLIFINLITMWWFFSLVLLYFFGLGFIYLFGLLSKFHFLWKMFIYYFFSFFFYPGTPMTHILDHLVLLYRKVMLYLF